MDRKYNLRQFDRLYMMLMLVDNYEQLWPKKKKKKILNITKKNIGNAFLRADVESTALIHQRLLFRSTQFLVINFAARLVS